MVFPGRAGLLAHPGNIGKGWVPVIPGLLPVLQKERSLYTWKRRSYPEDDSIRSPLIILHSDGIQCPFREKRQMGHSWAHHCTLYLSCCFCVTYSACCITHAWRPTQDSALPNIVLKHSKEVYALRLCFICLLKESRWEWKKADMIFLLMFRMANAGKFWVQYIE